MRDSRFSSLILLMCLICFGNARAQTALQSIVAELDHLPGKPENLATPYVAAGNRVYMVGFQNGGFPDLGWHITGEMGGIWNHPIKLMDGFAAHITNSETGRSICLDKAAKFVNYPVGNLHHFSWTEEEIEVNRFQFVPDDTEGMIVEYQIVNNGKTDKKIEFEFTGRVDLRPTWLGEKTDMIDAEDDLRFDESASVVIGKDRKNTWFAAFGSMTASGKYEARAGSCASPRSGMGKEGTLSYNVTVKGGGGVINIPFFIAGSYKSEGALLETYRILKSGGEKKLREKINRYNAMTNTSRLVLPDKEITRMYDWLKYNTDWLVREVPEVGVGLSAGLPDYPWWFGCDNTYALQGALASGNHALAKKTIELLTDISTRANANNGRIVHEVSTNGAVFNPGNVNETAQFVHLVWVYYTWTGDKELISRLYPFLQKGIAWLKQMDPDGNQYPNGSGMMEIHGLDTEMIDVVVYTQQAFSSLALLAEELGDGKSAEQYRRQAEQLKTKINNEWWSESAGSYADFRASDAATLPILDAAIVRADTLKKAWSVSELRGRRAKLDTSDANTTNAQVVYHNWVVNTPMETGVADREKGLKALKTSRQYENAFGAYVTGIDRSNEPDSIVLASRKKTFSYTGAVMTLPTAVQAMGAANLGEPDLALEFIEKLQASFSYVLPGSMYEVSPDFGMFTQAWNIYGVAVPIIQKFFGVQPLAHKRTVVLKPDLPTEWNDVAIENLKVGPNVLSVALTRADNVMAWKIRQAEASWSVVLSVATMPSRVMLNGKVLDPKRYANQEIILSGKQNELKVFFQ